MFDFVDGSYDDENCYVCNGCVPSWDDPVANVALMTKKGIYILILYNQETFANFNIFILSLLHFLSFFLLFFFLVQHGARGAFQTVITL